MKSRAAFIASVMLLAGATVAHAFEIDGTQGTKLRATEIASFNEPWAMTFLPNGDALISEKSGTLQYMKADSSKMAVAGVPEVAYGGQGGLGDVIIHPGFAANNLVYLSYAESGSGGNGAVVVRAKLSGGDAPALSGIERIWEQDKVRGRGHYSHKMAFGPTIDLYITSGDRQKLNPAQDMKTNLGKLIRLRDDGAVPGDNPYQNDGEIAKTFWTIGHRNLLGIAFDDLGVLWTHEMGPRHGDELNAIEVGSNYGWPEVSNGDHYSGIPITDHDKRPEFNAPEAFWVPSIAPAGLEIYGGDLFSAWKGDALIGGLAGQALIRVDIEGLNATEAERYEWGSRVREVEQGPDGAVYVLEDGAGGRLLKLEPA